MKQKEIVRTLKKAGWKITSGGKHKAATHPNRPGVKIPIPHQHGKEMDEHTAKGILRAAGLL